VSVLKTSAAQSAIGGRSSDKKEAHRVIQSLNILLSHSRSLKIASFDRPYTTFYWSTIVNIALSGTVLELLDVE